MILFCISLFFPLLSFIVSGLFSHSSKNFLLGIFCSLLMIISTTASLMLTASLGIDEPLNLSLKEFINFGGLDLNFGFYLDAISLVMLSTVGIVASIVHIYSVGYMRDDASFNRFFSYLGLFVFCMNVLVSSDNFIGLFIGWEGVGLCSWLLIGFWYKRPSANVAANEAFIMNRVADLAMLIGIFYIFYSFGSLKFSEVFNARSDFSGLNLGIIATLLFIGAMGKSAQFPFHTWLANAMEGPTPVSALIHAATMVTAGVYLVIRANFIFINAPEVSHFIAYLGTFVAIFAASIALVHNDLKKIIAYSTLSQLGYMFVAAGLGAYKIALFHLVTHAFFKSLLFLCAGNVMHAMNDELNIKKMGGLYKFMKPTALLSIIASCALAGFYPFAGFFSKDKILEVSFSENKFLWIILLFGAVLTAFYSFRLVMLVFFTKPKSEKHVHEAKNYMLAGMGVLGILSVISGFFWSNFSEFLEKSLNNFSLNLSHGSKIFLLVLTLGLVLTSTGFAIFAYKKEIFKESICESRVYKILQNAYFIPKFYEKFFINGYTLVSQICKKIDEMIIDRSVDLVVTALNKFANLTNKMQSGDLSIMLRFMVAGLALLLSFIFLLNGAK
ncbi:NADH-quinone oxidoreductase subunit L [Campylobacter concisus]|uniref:NADH-quinone oxidoreductase subunit L n=1 Tax=Campylobacter concisus TaxID=199 RepID=UPI00188445EA|nr:NADH-quinone oxidoreductase subunit L [Campylobacter concisus]MBE9818364.1 NADH-quinone oxidoreductase subunit L [Campylobacter concisus]